MWAITNDKVDKEERKKRSEDRVSDVRVNGCPRLIRMYYSYAYVDVCTLPGGCTERPTATFLDVYSWKLTYSELML